MTKRTSKNKKIVGFLDCSDYTRPSYRTVYVTKLDRNADNTIIQCWYSEDSSKALEMSIDDLLAVRKCETLRSKSHHEIANLDFYPQSDKEFKDYLIRIFSEHVRS